MMVAIVQQFTFVGHIGNPAIHLGALVLFQYGVNLMRSITKTSCPPSNRHNRPKSIKAKGLDIHRKRFAKVSIGFDRRIAPDFVPASIEDSGRFSSVRRDCWQFLNPVLGILLQPINGATWQASVVLKPRKILRASIVRQ